MTLSDVVAARHAERQKTLERVREANATEFTKIIARASEVYETPIAQHVAQNKLRDQYVLICSSPLINKRLTDLGND